MIQADYNQTIEFLKKIHPGRKWVLTGIAIDPATTPPTVTQTFDESRIDGCVKWLSELNPMRGLYFSLAEPRGMMMKKMDRADVQRIHFLHIDLDPREGEDIQKEQDRILKLIKNCDKVGLPYPSAIWCSGSGYQAIWRLEKPIEIDRDLDKAEDAKLYNVKIEQLLDGDACHNVDRILRLPGTVNLPSAKKKKKGRVECLAHIVELNDKVYPIERFTKADAVAAKSASAQAPFNPPIIPGTAPAGIKKLAGTDDLDKYGVSAHLKMVVAQGTDPLNPKRFPSRSEWLIYAVSGLVRAQVPDDVVFSVLTDPQFGISDSVLELGKPEKIERYANRQIERAKAEIDDPHLRIMNERFAVIENMNGKCRILEMQHDPNLKRDRLTFKTAKDLELLLMNKVKLVGYTDSGKPINCPMDLWWLKSPHRRQYRSLCYAPGIDRAENYNLWHGFGYDPKAGDCSLFLDHVRNVICNGNEEHYDYVMKWCANAVQHPATPGQSAIVLKGDQGTGKGVFARMIGALFGRHFLQISNSKHLVGNFNAHLRDVSLLFADECMFAGDKAHANILKTLITEHQIMLESKGIDPEPISNCVHLIMASNDHWVVPAGIGDRRFLVLKVNNSHKEDTAYFEALDNHMTAGGYEALLHHFQTLDLSKFDVRKVPKTEELQTQKGLTLDAEWGWWREKLIDGRILPEHGEWQTDVPETALYIDYLDHCRFANTYRRATKTVLREIINQFVPTIKRYNSEHSLELMQPNGTAKRINRPVMLSFPSLEDCRKMWEKSYGGKVEWPTNCKEVDLYAGYR